MPDNDKLEKFIDTLHDVDGDDQIMKELNVKGLLKEGGKFISNTVHDWTHNDEIVPEKHTPKPPATPSVPTPTYQESAFLSRGHETSLYNVTNREDKLPEVTTKSNIFSHVKYRFKGLNASAELRDDGNHYTVFAGKRIGVGKTMQTGQVRSELKAFYKVSMHHAGTSTVEYSVDTPSSWQRVSIYNNDSASGASYNYSNKRGFTSAFSADTESASVRIGYDGKYQGTNIEAEAYFTTGKDYSSPYFGVSGRISF